MTLLGTEYLCSKIIVFRICAPVTKEEFFVLLQIPGIRCRILRLAAAAAAATRFENCIDVKVEFCLRFFARGSGYR